MARTRGGKEIKARLAKVALDEAYAHHRRIAHQRALFAALPPGPEVSRLKEAMLQRAYDLMWAGRSEECDALLEFLPADEAKAG